jgi:Tocopherol cyclase
VYIASSNSSKTGWEQGMTDWQGRRWDGGAGHYESWFQRANHPTRPLAFWVRHTIFCPKGKPEAAVGEIWAVWFNGETGRVVAGKSEAPMRDCVFDSNGLGVSIPGARLAPGSLQGNTGPINWALTWVGGGPTSLLLPEAVYQASFPKAKVLCVNPNALFSGHVNVNGHNHPIKDWPGSHNHNWGSQHTDRYAWAQVCGFDGAPGVFLECATAQVKVGPLLTPQVTVAVLSIDGQRYEFNSILRGLWAKAEVKGFSWQFSASQGGVEIEVNVEALRENFAGLRYGNPPGGDKACLNSKIARCHLRFRKDGVLRSFTSENRAAFEILCEENDPRVADMGGLQL